MKFIPVDQIKILPDRQRREFDEAALRELIDSIQARGLYHPIVLRLQGDSYVLVSGERRLRAVSDIYSLGGTFNFDSCLVPAGCIPYSSLAELSDLDAEEAELEENIRRVNLTWQERAAVTAKLSALRAKQAAAAGRPAPGPRELALEIKDADTESNKEDTRRELIVGRNLHRPSIKAAKTVDEAFKILKKEEATERNRALAETIGRSFTAEAHTALNLDALPWLVECPSESFDVILSDPPYGMGADEFGDSGGLAAGAHTYADSQEVFDRIMQVFIPHSFRIAKPEAHLYLFCDFDKFPKLRTSLMVAGWRVFRTPLLWHKPNGMRAPWPYNGPQRRYECILYAMKGMRKVTCLRGDVLEYRPDENLGHAAQKPVELFVDLLSRSVLPGNTILDPFCGSGPIFPAAHSMKCRATGIELDGASYSLAVKRIEALKHAPELDLP